MSSNGEGDRRVAVVTGGAGAIGGAIVARLAPGHTVVVLDRAGDVAVDLGDPDDVRRAARLVLDRHGRCDVLVHAAATFKSGPLEQVGHLLLSAGQFSRVTRIEMIAAITVGSAIRVDISRGARESAREWLMSGL